MAASMEELDCSLTASSPRTGLKINDCSKVSGSELEEAVDEEPPRRECNPASLNSFLNNVELVTPFLTLLLR